MKFNPLELEGAWEIEIEPYLDERGFFSRTWCEQEAKELGLAVKFSQSSVSRTLKKGTVRGLHYQKVPYGESKLVSCSQGRIFDVLVDLRPDSQTFGCWVHVELSAEKLNSVYIPQGCAHGFQTLEDNCDVRYQISVPYEPSAASGILWNDQTLAIKWPLPATVVSKKDLSFENYQNYIVSLSND